MDTTPQSARVTLRVEDRIAHVALNRPEQLNGLDIELIEQLVKTAKQIRRDRSIRAVG